MKKLRNIVKILMTFFIIQNNERKGFNTITNKNLAESRFQLNSDIDNKTINLAGLIIQKIIKIE